MITIEDVDDECYYLNKLHEAEEKVKRLQERNEKLEKMAFHYTPEEWNTMLRMIARLQEQLNEANEVIKKYASGEYKVKAPKYVGTCYGTNLITGEPEKEDLYEGYYFAKVPFANNTKPATAYLEKWGVK